MKSPFLLALCCFLFWSEEARAEIDNEVKRGVFPFMAVIYYPDEAVVDSTGARFQRGGVLIRPKWLISSAIDHSVLDNIPLGFPRKTMLARVGAVTLDSNYTLNEDEDEQEREVIQVVRPNIHNPDMWWFTDITLLQTLLPFKMTSAVGFTSISPKREYADKNCVILVYAKRYGNVTEDKILMQLGVELLPPSIDNCGTQFSDSTMTCAGDSDETKTAVFDPDFCQGNSGGPLMCEGEVMALQTYIDNNCKQPHVYQLLASWDSFINCGTEEKCNSDPSCNMCVTVNKDSDSTGETVAPPMTTITQEIIINTTTIMTTETLVDESDTPPMTTTPDTEQPQSYTTPTELPTTESSESATTEAKVETTTDTSSTVTTTVTTQATESETKSWPVERSRKTDKPEELTRKPKLEAQQMVHNLKSQPQVAQTSGSKQINIGMLVIYYVAFYVIVMF